MIRILSRIITVLSAHSDRSWSSARPPPRCHGFNLCSPSCARQTELIRRLPLWRQRIMECNRADVAV